MAIWNWMLGQYRSWKLEDYAEEIAFRKLESIWDRVANRVGQMSLAEARGYIRARAAVAVSRELQAALVRYNGLEPHRSRVADMATDVVLYRLERRIFEAQRLVLPRRKAA